LQCDAASIISSRPPPDFQELVARFGGFSRPVDECAKFDAVMVASAGKSASGH
jgi:hypothetical protein